MGVKGFTSGVMLVVAALLPFEVYAGSTSAKKSLHHSKKRVHVSYVRHGAAKHAAKKVVSAGATQGKQLSLLSSSALVIDQETGEVLYGKNANAKMPIASITKLMTSMVVLDAQLPLDEKITITNDDVDHLRNSSSRLRVGTTLSRRLLLRLALMSSENRAAAALARTYPGGLNAFVAAMNQKAVSLGMRDTTFVDSSGLHSDNTSTAQDLVKMVKAAHSYALIREMTTTPSYDVAMQQRGNVEFRNTNQLVRAKSKSWHIELSKTGFINEAGHCLVMQALIAKQPTIIVLLDSWGKFSRIGDANRIKKWIESSNLKQRFG